MRIIQMATTLVYGDAIGNDIVALDKTIKKAGYETTIYAEYIGDRIPIGIAQNISNASDFNSEDIVLYHLSTGTDLNYKVPSYNGRKIVIYHNITPYKFFSGYSNNVCQTCKKGIEGAKYLSDKVDYCLADSSYNKQELEELGYKCNIDVLPILIPFDDYKKNPNKNIIKKYAGDGYKNIIFTGRVVPNKCQEDIIAAFYQYHRYYNEKSRLILIGTFLEPYYKKLKRYVKQLGIEGNVVFTGHIKFDEILAYYSIADLFLCMSEHEGFCVPLVEAMFFDIPIIAYDSSAIAETLGGSGFILKEKEPLETAGVMNYILNDTELRGKIIQAQRTRLKDFSHDAIEKQFLSYIENFIRTQ